eukprot:Em0015g915a
MATDLIVANGTNASCGGSSTFALVTFGSINGVAALVCCVAAMLVFVFKLHKKTVYRLALYQDLAAMSFASACALFLIFLHYPITSIRPLCVLLSFVGFFSQWAKLLFTWWIAFHLFSFAVCLKNWKALEALYVVSTLFLSVVIAIVPFTTNTYGPAGSWCWIVSSYNNSPSTPNTEGVIEQFVLWYGPSTIILSLSSSAMVVMLAVLTVRVCTQRKKMRSQLGSNGSPNWKALKQLLPLAAYPIVFLILIIPPSINRVLIYVMRDKEPSFLPELSAASVGGWSFAAGVTLIIHVTVARVGKKANKRMERKNLNDYGSVK